MLWNEQKPYQRRELVKLLKRSCLQRFWLYRLRFAPSAARYSSSGPCILQKLAVTF